jgi:hypothetical protein
MTYTGRATSGNGITFTGVTRGTDGTIAAQHSLNAGVQECLRYTNEPLNDILENLIVDFGGVDASFCNTSGWQDEFDAYRSFYNLTTLITSPVSVQKLVSELQEQCAIYVWWDERASLIEMKAIRGLDAVPPTITDEANIVEGSFALTEKPRERASQVWFSYQQLDPTKSITDETNYQTTFILAYPESETDDLYGEPSIRKIFSRWLQSDILIQSTASIIGTRYVDVPSEATFILDAKDRSYWVGDNLFVSHYLDRDQFGARRVRQWTIVSAEEIVPGEQVRYICEDTTLYGEIYFIMANGAADYPGYDVAPVKNCYIGDANGLLSDGESAGRIS